MFQWHFYMQSSKSVLFLCQWVKVSLALECVRLHSSKWQIIYENDYCWAMVQLSHIHTTTVYTCFFGVLHQEISLGYLESLVFSLHSPQDWRKQSMAWKLWVILVVTWCDLWKASWHLLPCHLIDPQKQMLQTLVMLEHLDFWLLCHFFQNFSWVWRVFSCPAIISVITLFYIIIEFNAVAFYWIQYIYLVAQHEFQYFALHFTNCLMT